MKLSQSPKSRGISSVLSLFALVIILSATAFAQTTAFTYQGRLTDTLVAANGPYDMRFSLFDASAGGTQQGMTQTVLGVNIVAGIFTVSLDFGDQFNGADRYLLIAVKKQIDPTFTDLAPRQQITSAPYAIRAKSVAPTAGNNVIAALNDGATNTVINDSVLPPNLVRTQPAAPQISASTNNNGSDPLVHLRGTYTNPPGSSADFKIGNDGSLLATGFVRDVGNTNGCANFIPATGAGTRFMWHPCRGSLRFGRVPTAQANWDDANMDDFTFAGGNQVVASGYGAFAFGDQVTASSTVGVGFGSGVTVSGTAGFSAGASNICSGFACTAIGYTVAATGQGSTALGYRTGAFGDYTTALGYRAVTCSSDPVANNCTGTSYTGAFIIGDESTTSFVRSQAINEFRARFNGGYRLRVSTAANGNTPGAGGNVGCDLTVAVPSWTCASSRDVKENFKMVGGEDILSNLRSVPFMTFNYINDKSLTRNFGPMAEDFFKAFKLGDNDKSINTHNLASISLAGVKALEERTANLQKENDRLRSQLTTLESRLQKLEQNAAPKRSVKRRR